MKEITLSITVTVPDDETDKNWDKIVKGLGTFIENQGYSIYDTEWNEVKY